MPSIQNRRKRRFGAYLAELRNSAGRTTTEVGALLRKDASQVSKVENGHHLPAFAELTALLVFYSADDAERAQAETLWNDAKQDSRRIQGSSAVPPKFRTFLRNEADAEYECELQSQVVPGMLQSADYAKAVHASGHRIIDPKIGEQRVTAARLARQELLRGSDPLRFHAIMDVGVIRRVVGGRDCMIEQLRHLLDIGHLDNVEIQVIPEDAGAYGPMSGPFTILGYSAPDDPDSVYCEYIGGGEWVDDPADVQTFKLIFEDVSDLALSSVESATLIETRIRELEDP
jgi:transcriptional regulator with XRE-family HTH domain